MVDVLREASSSESQIETRLRESLQHSHAAAGERPVGQPYAVPAFPDRLCAQPVAAVGHAGSRRGLGDRIDVRYRAERPGCTWSKIRDEFRVVGLGKGGANDAGRPVQRRHRIENMCHSVSPALEAFCLRCRSRRMNGRSAREAHL